MKKLIISFSFLLGLCSMSSAQMDFGLNLGGANYLGEIGGNEGEAKPWLLDMKMQQFSYAFGGFYRYNFTPKIAAKVSFNYLRIEGADSLSNEPTRIGRNLSFRTEVVELYLSGEYNFFQINDLSRRSRTRMNFGTYITAGVGIAWYYPYAQHQGEWYYLRPLQTEGVENAYEETTVIVPVGMGAHLTLNNKWRFGVEFNYRFTFTDYLDDVSTNYAFDEELPFAESFFFSNRSEQAYQNGRITEEKIDPRFYGPGARRGGPDANDGYLVAQFSISRVIAGKTNFSKSRYNSVINRRRKRTKF